MVHACKMHPTSWEFAIQARLQSACRFIPPEIMRHISVEQILYGTSTFHQSYVWPARAKKLSECCSGRATQGSVLKWARPSWYRSLLRQTIWVEPCQPRCPRTREQSALWARAQVATKSVIKVSRHGKCGMRHVARQRGRWEGKGVMFLVSWLGS